MAIPVLLNRTKECTTVVLTAMHHRSTFAPYTTVMHRENGMARKDPQFNLRLPEELKQWVEVQAQKNHRSQTAELVYLIAEEKRRQEQAAA
jgi:hypothetical protein